MLPRVIEVVVRITTARVLSDPSAIAVDVRSIRVTWLIAKIAVFLSRMRITSKGSRAVGRAWMASLFPSLRQGWK